MSYLLEISFIKFTSIWRYIMYLFSFFFFLIWLPSAFSSQTQELWIVPGVYIAPGNISGTEQVPPTFLLRKAVKENGRAVNGGKENWFWSWNVLNLWHNFIASLVVVVSSFSKVQLANKIVRYLKVCSVMIWYMHTWKGFPFIELKHSTTPHT